VVALPAGRGSVSIAVNTEIRVAWNMGTRKTSFPPEGSKKISPQEKRLIRACEIVDRDPAVREVEEDFGALTDEIAEPWDVPRCGAPG